MGSFSKQVSSAAFLLCLAFSFPAKAEKIFCADGSEPKESSCSAHGGYVLPLEFEAKTQADCLQKISKAQGMGPQVASWLKKRGDAPATADAGDQYQYCRKMFPDMASASGSGGAASVQAKNGTMPSYRSTFIVPFDSNSTCTTRLKLAAEIPSVGNPWGTDIEGYCKKFFPGKYRMRWDAISGSVPGWTTGWVSGHDQPRCGFGDGCDCGPADNACRTYASDEVATYFPFGCGTAAWKVKCTAEPEEGNPAAAKVTSMAEIAPDTRGEDPEVASEERLRNRMNIEAIRAAAKKYDGETRRGLSDISGTEDLREANH